MRIRKIKKYGNTWIIKLHVNDASDMGFKEGDDVIIDDIRLYEKPKEIQLNGELEKRNPYE